MAEPKFWKIRDGQPAQRGEFPEGAQEPMGLPADPDDPSRRRFLAVTGASAALAAGIACTGKLDQREVVPYAKSEEAAVPGVASYYATSFQEGAIASPVLVKTREGRPLMVEGNDRHPGALGKANFRATADLLGLYDPDRLREPLENGQKGSWDSALSSLAVALKRAKEAGQGVLLVMPALVSPTRRALVAELQAALPTLKVAPVEPAADAEGVALERELWGQASLFQHRFDKARVVLSLEADFLGTWGDAATALRRFAEQRRPESPTSSMARLYTFEGTMSLTGSKADHRVPVRPSALPSLAFALAKALHEKGLPLPSGVEASALAAFDLAKWASENGTDLHLLEALAVDLASAQGAALAVAGPAAPPAARAATHLLNAMLGAEGATLEVGPETGALGLRTLAEVESLKAEVASGAFAVALIWEANPLHAAADPVGWEKALERVPLKARLGLLADETAKACSLVLPIHHWLESWNDFDGLGVVNLQQPAVAPLYDTRQAEDILLHLLATLGGNPASPYLAYLKGRWEREVFSAGMPVPFASAWNAALHDGFLLRPAAASPQRTLTGEALVGYVKQAAGDTPGAVELTLLADAKTYDGRYANNGWLQELPDPVTKTTWENPLLLAPADAKALGAQDGDLVRLTVGSATVELPVVVQPGQAEGVVSVALGYGRRSGSVAQGVGTPVWPLVGAGGLGLWKGGVTLALAGGKRPLARTQEHHSLHGRDIVRQWTLAEWAEGPHASHGITPLFDKEGKPLSMYPEANFPDHKWGMSIDLSACVGCSGCVIACQSENNIPVVGPEQVAMGREMHWLRIDRYYEGPEESPRAVHQPMLCQQCDNAPCENVCPVQATNHSPDGLNQMAYNRCVGTRYCANNCPYKVRRFNFFDFTSTLSEPLTLAFNPEVTVRPRGVMEKCTFCVQRIQNGRQVAKGEGRPLRDGEIVPACAAACPAKAIVFGDLKDPKSEVSRLSAHGRGFKVLEELGVRPAVTYLADIQNPALERGADHEA